MTNIYGISYDKATNKISSCDAIFEDNEFIKYDDAMANCDPSLNVKPGTFKDLTRKEKISLVNDMLSDGRLTVSQCKDCGKYYILNTDEVKWYTENKMRVPVRCINCRSYRKAEENKNERR